MTVQPGESWHRCIELWQRREAIAEAVEWCNGARSLPGATGSGRHTIAVRCGQQWSGDLVFIEK